MDDSILPPTQGSRQRKRSSSERSYQDETESEPSTGSMLRPTYIYGKSDDDNRNERPESSKMDSSSSRGETGSSRSDSGRDSGSSPSPRNPSQFFRGPRPFGNDFRGPRGPPGSFRSPRFPDLRGPRQRFPDPRGPPPGFQQSLRNFPPGPPPSRLE